MLEKKGQIAEIYDVLYLFRDISYLWELMEYFMVMIYFGNKFIDFREKILQCPKYITFFLILFYCPPP